ncbi:hypothetical protein RRG08_015827 [Elysia crispata]|uniref:Uncharacterized protein n=1 Tax=Elysia crispata TaxID=231223 RepID=A0AAE1A2R4_9GAST|nr:hypothetical protein RRG08_015827 [Elysia crispata]
MSAYLRFSPLWVENYGNSSHNITKCPGGVHWMLKYLGACARNPQEQASEYLGLLSMILWMMVGIPQIVKNFRNLDGLAGVSFFLLFQWAGGDITNLVGSLLTHQLPFQIYLAIYFVFVDAILLLQYSTYYVKRLRMQRSHSVSDAERNEPAAPRLILCLLGIFLCSRMLLSSSSQSADTMSGLEFKSKGHISRALLSMSDEDDVLIITQKTQPLLFHSEMNNSASSVAIGKKASNMGKSTSHFTDQTDREILTKDDNYTSVYGSLLGTASSFWHTKTDIIGYAIGIVSSIFYLGSRIAQIVKNTKKKSTDGLSQLMFFLAVLGNLAYGLQILVHSVETEFLLEKTPWLVGSLGVIGLDCTLLAQFHFYKDKQENIDEMRRSLINNEITVNGNSPSVNGPTLAATTDVENGEDGRHALIF